jgi:hypothetical protein
MLSNLIWAIGIGLEILLIGRALRAKVFTRYPVFYGYISYVLAQSLVRLVVHGWWYPRYKPVFWVTELLGLLAGSYLVFEIYRVALADYPGTAQMARNVLGFLFAMAVARVIAALWGGGLFDEATSMLEVERALRTVQAIAIAALVALFVFYSIPFGRNLRGMLLGYSVFIAERVISLTFVAPTGRDFWFYAYSASYPVVLAIWAAHLWSYQPSPENGRSQQLEQEYQLIAAATQRRFQEARGYLRKVVRS